MQQRAEVSVIENSSGDGQEVAEHLPAQGVWLMAQPSRQRRVRADDASVKIGDDVAARSAVPEVLDAAIGHGARAKAEMADAVASGALTCGQCPVASNVTS